MTPLKKRCEIDVILNLLSEGLTKKDIKKRLNIKPSTLSNHLRRLENSGYIERKGKYIINVLSSSYSHLRVTKNQVHNRLNKRGHAFNFTVLFPKEKNLLENNKVQHELKVGNLEELPFGSLKLIKDKCSIWINKKSLTIYSNNSYYVKNALHSKFAALKDVDNLVNNLKDKFGFSGIYGIEVFREHYGLIFNKFAEWIIKRGKKLYVKEKGNKTILWVDDSRKDDIGLKEFEAADPLKINAADEYFNSHERTGWKVTPEFSLKIFNEAGELIKKNAENLEYHAENMRSHVIAVQQLGKSVQELTEIIKEMKR
jgi:hypothetical protein